MKCGVEAEAWKLDYLLKPKGCPWTFVGLMLAVLGHDRGDASLEVVLIPLLRVQHRFEICVTHSHIHYWQFTTLKKTRALFWQLEKLKIELLLSAIYSLDKTC